MKWTTVASGKPIDGHLNDSSTIQLAGDVKRDNSSVSLELLKHSVMQIWFGPREQALCNRSGSQMGSHMPRVAYFQLNSFQRNLTLINLTWEFS
jgi:hypothetical protein